MKTKPPAGYLATIGANGGRKGVGASKRRGGPEYYRQLAAKAWAKRRAKK